jgi:protoporphyrinogen oxidase
MERARLREQPYVGIVCASVLLRAPLHGAYLTYLGEIAPFTGIVEMSALTGVAPFGGRTLVYLPRYAVPDDPVFDDDDERIEQRFIEGLRAVHPRFDPSDVLAFRVSRARHVFVATTLHASQRVPPFRTSVPGVHLCNSAQILHGTLNVDETLRLADRFGEQFR